MNSTRWKNKILKYFVRGIFALCARHIESGTHLRQNIVVESEKKPASWAVKSSDFRRGLREWGGGEAGRGLLPPGFYGGREWRMGTGKGKGRRREGRSYSEPKPHRLGRNAGVVFTTDSPKSICYANLHSSHSPIHPNQYANLLLGKVGVRCSRGGRRMRRGCPFVQVGSRVQWVGGWGEGGDRHTCICSSWTLGWTMEI